MNLHAKLLPKQDRKPKFLIMFVYETRGSSFRCASANTLSSIARFHPLQLVIGIWGSSSCCSKGLVVTRWGDGGGGGGGVGSFLKGSLYNLTY